MGALGSTVAGTDTGPPLPPAVRRAGARSVRLGSRDIAGLLSCADTYGAPYDLPAPRGALVPLVAKMRRNRLIVCADCHEDIHANPVANAA
jgi:hypothetical protein